MVKVSVKAEIETSLPYFGIKRHRPKGTQKKSTTFFLLINKMLPLSAYLKINNQ